MSVKTLSDELLNRTFRLAHFILGERTAATYLTMTAADKLKIASTIQGRRLEYVPVGRPAYPASRTKVSLNRTHLLQRLVYAESEPFEILLQAQGKPLRQQDMIIRFVKHLVMITAQRNSFYVSLGLCRLLHNYTTSETSGIYDLLIQDPDRSRDDYYYRSRKQRLLNEMRGRFGDCLKTYKGHRGEERFEAHEDSGQYLGLVRECLSRFTPWDSSCVLPAGIDPAREVAVPLLFQGTDPDHEHEIEINRIHTLLHPGCLELLTETLGLDPPSRRLEVPRFSTQGDARGLTEDRLNPEPLSRDELDAIRRLLDKNTARRADASRSLLAVLIDGEEWARFEVARTRRVWVTTPRASRWLEVRSADPHGDVTLALHPLRFHAGRDERVQTSVVRGAGHRLSFEERQSDGPSADTFCTTVSVDYHEARAGVLLYSLGRRFAALLAGRIDLRLPRGLEHTRFALGSLLIMVCVAGLLLYLFRGGAPPAAPPPPGGEQIARQDGAGGQPPAPAPTPLTQARPAPRTPGGAPPRARGTVRPGPPGRGQTSPPAAPPSLLSGADSAEDVGETRGQGGRTPTPSLLAVRRVYVDPLAGEGESRQVGGALAKALLASGRFTVVERREDADAVFSGTVRRSARGGEGVTVTLLLVTAKGHVLWPSTPGGAGATYSGHPSSVTGRIVKDLMTRTRGPGRRD